MAFIKAKALEEAEKSLAQGKTGQAIKQYLAIFEKEPTDLGLLNTVGDLYVREKNMPEALKSFHKLADSYTQEGFTVKAIAIYKKIAKLDPAAVEVTLRIADLYMVQGLSREAREQYSQALDFYKKKNQNDKALEICRKIVGLDPENPVYRTRLAEFCESVGKRAEAAQAYLEIGDVTLRRGDFVSAENALKKVLPLDPQNSQVPLLKFRLAIAQNRYDEAAKLLESDPVVKADAQARRALLETYFSSHNFSAAEALALQIFQANPEDFSPLASYAEHCLAEERIDAAFHILSEVADSQIEHGRTAPLMELLRQIWSKNASHLPTLEMIRKVAEKTGDEFTLPEVLEALGNAYAAAGELEKAEGVYRKLLERQPEDEQLNALLKQILKKEGKEQPVAQALELASAQIALAPEPEPATATPPPSADASAEEAATVKEALDNSDLFARYGLMDKAYAELDRALALYPDQLELHKRTFELAQKGEPERASQAARALSRIYAASGDSASARKYEQMAGAPVAATAAVGEQPPPVAASPAPEPPPMPAPEPAAPLEFDLSGDFLGGVSTEAPAPPMPPSPAEFDLGPPAPEAPPPSAAAPPVELDLSAPLSASPVETPPVQEFDLSGGWEAATSPPTDESAAPPEALPVPPEAGPTSDFNFDDSKIEVEYYLDQGFMEEAEKAVRSLEEKYPGNAQVAELRHLVDRRVSGEPAELAEVPDLAPPFETPPAPQAEPPAPAPAEEWELPTAFGAAEPAELEKTIEAPHLAEEPIPSATELPPAAPTEASGLGSLIEGLEDSLEGITTAPGEHLQVEETPARGAAPASGTPAAPSPLSGLLEELGEGEQPQAGDDPQTHYDLGVAFREMSLLDEAIGEFQKVVKGAHKGHFPPNFLQACTLLAVCFMDKKLPAIAAKWYLRALELPDLDDEATLAVQYDLGVAYEQAGDIKSALERFSEVYSQNIDYRDVAEKIRLLQAKP